VLNETQSRVFIAVDVMKKVEMDGVSEIIKNMNKFGVNIDGKQVISNYNLKFKDSKSKDCTLIQAADIFAGIIRSSFEDIYINFSRLPRCKTCFNLIKTKKIKTLCNKNTLRVANSSLGNFKYIKHLICTDKDGYLLFNGINCFPIESINKLRFIECNHKK
jgi:hypothetical protein